MITSYYLNLIANHIFNGAASLPPSYYIGLSSTKPQSNGGGVTEPSASAGYSRVLLSDLSDPVNGVVKNNSNIPFPKSSASWNSIGYYVVFDAPTGGHLLMGGSLSRSNTITSNMTVVIKPGTIKLSVVDANKE